MRHHGRLVRLLGPLPGPFGPLLSLLGQFPRPVRALLRAQPALAQAASPGALAQGALVRGSMSGEALFAVTLSGSASSPECSCSTACLATLYGSPVSAMRWRVAIFRALS